MICDRCYETKDIAGRHGNELLCENCLHNARPASHRIRDVEDLKPTMKNLKKILEKKF